MKLSDLIGKQIYSLYETIAVGTTCQALFNSKYTKIQGFYFFDENEDEHYLKISNIYGFGDFLTIKNFNQISNEFPVEEMPTPLNKTMLDEKGNSLGFLTDMIIDEKGTVLEYISSTGKNIPTLAICSNKDYILCSENIKLKNFKPKDTEFQKINNLDNVKVKIMRIDSMPQQDIKYMPPKITVSTESFIGKIAKEDIFGKNNELLIKKNQSITPKALEVIKQHNRLNQLYHLCF